MILIGSLFNITVNLKTSTERMGKEKIKNSLKQIGITDFFIILSLQRASNKHLKETIPPNGIINTDYSTILEYKAPISLYTASNSKRILKKLDERRLPKNKRSLIADKYPIYSFMLDKIYRP
jgi:hypothetical protein